MTTTETRPVDGTAAEPFSTGTIEGRMRARVLIPEGTIAPFGYLTPQDEFGDVERGNPLPYTLPRETRRSVGLERETWRLEIVADPASNTKLERPLSKEAGTAMDFEGLLKLGQRHAVRYVKAITCNNIGEPLGMGLWEGVPLRVAIWQARPVENLRRVYFYGYHNDDPAQVFQSSLPIGRVLEDPPGELPVLLAYKVNGEYLNGRRGGPVRMIVPEAYGFKSVKWLQKIVLTNDYQANDTYHSGNNDLESAMKTFAKFVHVPASAKVGETVAITGMAQVGVSGLEKVQYWVRNVEEALPAEPDDAHPAFPTFAQAPWRDAEILPAPEKWGGGVPDGQAPDAPLQFDPMTGMPREWPMRYAVCYWAAALEGLRKGTYDVRCRSIDKNGIAQPMPRPFPKSGRAAIPDVKLVVE